MWPVPSPGLDILQWEKWPISKARLKGEICLGRFRVLVLSGGSGGQDRKAIPIIRHMYFN
jgi:hypothetical protein